ncbi:hypothetical protein AX14_014462 [Amanita brunnescens Koide BX004]|nr:hypothetical protein AX14_014462 [Amanita brunnescens Koide BX004]
MPSLLRRVKSLFAPHDKKCEIPVMLAEKDNYLATHVELPSLAPARSRKALRRYEYDYHNVSPVAATPYFPATPHPSICLPASLLTIALGLSDHGAVGLAFLASGQHECLQGQKRTQSYTDSKRNSDADEDVKWPTVHANSPVARGSSSMPVSRTSGRTGTPQPLPQPEIYYLPTNSSVSVNTVGIAHAQRFPPPQASLQQRPQQPYRQYGHGRRLDDDRDRLGLSERKGEWTGGIHYKLDTPG